MEGSLNVQQLTHPFTTKLCCTYELNSQASNILFEVQKGLLIFMKIIEAEAISIDIPIKAPLRVSGGVNLDFSRDIIVKIIDEKGSSGYYFRRDL